MASIVSGFSKNLDNWTISGDPASFVWEAKGGDPGGFAHWVDQASGQDAYYTAPSKFLGSKGAYYGGSLSYDVEDTGNDFSGVPDIELRGHGMILVYQAGQAGTDWTHFSAKLVASGWKVGAHDAPVSGDPAATKADMKEVLAHLKSIEIRAEYVNGDENGGLDNVVLATPAGAQSAPRTTAAGNSDLVKSLFDAAFNTSSHADTIHAPHGHTGVDPLLAAASAHLGRA